LAETRPRDPNAIVISRVDKSYSHRGRTVTALSNISLRVARGEFVTLFGPSGCGKSTLLRLLAGLDTPDSGNISLFLQPPAEASQRKNIAWVPQSPALLPWLSVRQNAGLSEVVNRYADRRGQSERHPADVDHLLGEVGLSEFAEARPASLSGGMRQRVAIARGFAQGAPVMLMDEPFAALDALTRDALCRQLLHIFDSHRRTVVFVTHSAAEAVLLSDRVVVMSPRPGRIAATISVDLPRPRPPDIAERPDFLRRVTEVSRALATGALE